MSRSSQPGRSPLPASQQATLSPPKPRGTSGAYTVRARRRGRPGPAAVSVYEREIARESKRLNDGVHDLGSNLLAQPVHREIALIEILGRGGGNFIIVAALEPNLRIQHFLADTFREGNVQIGNHKRRRGSA